MTDHTDQADSVFWAAMAIQNSEERSAFLEQACGENVEMQEMIQDMISAYPKAEHFLEYTAEKSSGCFTEGPGQVIGGYRLLEEIGEGGFGIVFKAEQLTPLHRIVAFKVIKPGMDTRQVTARFEAERQALAMMDHPHIARVFDAGATESGRPYFVMEFVQGVPITDYCNQCGLGIEERLNLYLDTCQAVQHAHQKGIIHRDLKPSNVMVTLLDGQPVVKLIDFGIAKAIQGRLTDKTLLTGYAYRLGTPMYMSPEQMALSGLDVDTRTDVYSLGVLLYELLTGTTPFDRELVKRASFDELVRIVRDNDPPKPSTRIRSQSVSALAELGEQRRCDPHRLAQHLRGDLDWIVMKTLEKNRTRRYETASALAADVRCFLNNEPIQARPPSAWYRFRKFARRQTGLLATALVVTSLLVAATVVSTFFALRAEERARESRRALEDLQMANRLLELGEKELRDWRWDDAAAAFTSAIERQPKYRKCWVLRSDLYAELGLWNLARADLEAAFQLSPPDQTWRWVGITRLQLDAGDTPGYLKMCTQMYERFHGTVKDVEAIELLRAIVQAPRAAIAPQETVDVARSIVETNPGIAWYRYVLGLAEYRAGHFQQAIEELKQSYLVDPAWQARPLNLPILAMAYHHLGQQEAAERALADTASRPRCLDGNRLPRCRPPRLVHSPRCPAGLARPLD